MDRANWKEKIIKACKDAGTYKPFFDSVIDTLSVILENRDNAQKDFEDSGGYAVIEHTNQGGATNITKNPELTIIMDLNTQALAYWRDLGLTPAGLKKINDTMAKVEIKESALEKALKEIGGS